MYETIKSNKLLQIFNGVRRQGDSGGPLMCQRSGGQWELHGIVAGMIPGYTRYASTVYHKEWIAQQIQKLDWELL